LFDTQWWIQKEKKNNTASMHHNSNKSQLTTTTVYCTKTQNMCMCYMHDTNTSPKTNWATTINNIYRSNSRVEQSKKYKLTASTVSYITVN